MIACAVDGCAGTVDPRISAERVTVDEQYLNLCPYHARAHKQRFKKRPPHGVKLFFVAVPDGREPRVWLVRETSKLRARKVVASLTAAMSSLRIEWDTVMDESTKVSVANPDNIQTGALMVGRLA